MSTDRESSGEEPGQNDLELLKVKGFTPGRLLGTGSYSRVILIHKDSETRAVKVISKIKCPRDYLEDFLPKELEIFPTLFNENIIRCLELLESPTDHYILMEYADAGNLLERLQEEGQMEEAEARGIFRQTVRAVEYCHMQGVAHRDLKLDNLLLSRCDGFTKVKLSDFGFCVRTRNSGGDKTYSTTFCGSPPYTAPEVLEKGDPYDAEAADVWSLGVILYGMLYFRMPFKDSNISAMIQHQLQRQIKFPVFPSVCEVCQDLIRGMLEPEVNQRITVDAILKFTWLTQT